MKKNYTKITLVVGAIALMNLRKLSLHVDDRGKEFDVVSAGERDPDAADVLAWCIQDACAVDNDFMRSSRSPKNVDKSPANVRHCEETWDCEETEKKKT